jgi:hypothetical protein
MMLLPRLVLSEYSTQIVDMRVKEATTNDRSLTSASQRRGRFIRLFAHVGDVIMALVPGAKRPSEEPRACDARNHTFSK